MDREPIVWAILAPMPPDKMDAAAKTFRREKLGAGDKYLDAWEVVPCSGDYSALVNRNAGTRNVHEGPLAERLSKELTKPVYVLYLDQEHLGTEGVEEYRRGSYKGDVEELPYEFARRMGCSLGDEPELSITPPSRLRTVIVVEGAAAGDVARALDFDSPPKTKSMTIEDGPKGTIVYSQTIPDLSIFTHQLSAAFRRNNVYKVSTDPNGRFQVWVVRNRKNVGVFEHPEPTIGDTPPLQSILGESKPSEIVEALGVPSGLLNIPSQ